MKRLKQVLETADIIQFKPKTAKPSPTTISKEDANSQLSTIVGNKRNVWSHMSIPVRHDDHSLHNLAHSLHNLAHYIGNTYQNLYGDTGNHQAIGEFNKAKQRAKQVVKDERSHIRSHLSDTIDNLERLATNVQNSKFQDMPTLVKVHTTLHRWKKTRDALESVE